MGDGLSNHVLVFPDHRENEAGNVLKLMTGFVGPAKQILSLFGQGRVCGAPRGQLRYQADGQGRVRHGRGRAFASSFQTQFPVRASRATYSVYFFWI